MRPIDVEPLTLDFNVTFGEPEREDEVIFFNINLPTVNPETEARELVQIRGAVPCPIARRGADAMIENWERTFRTWDHWFGPISKRILANAVADFLRRGTLVDLAGRHPHLDNMPVMGRC